ncbi:MAG: DNA polymerase III subunit alpha [Flavobacteriaceae bacterium]|nr:DNA polymerase III subunit alpha [Flavobacteriaceae bacterium]
MFLVFDTETTGLPKRWDAPISDHENWPRCIQIAWQLHDGFGNCIEHKDFTVTPDGFDIPYESEQIHGISTALATKEGSPINAILADFTVALAKSKYIIGHNVKFDVNIIGAELDRSGLDTSITKTPILDTCTEHTAALCQIPGGRGGRFKLPTLSELYKQLFDDSFDQVHNATADVEATARTFFELLRQNKFPVNQITNGELLVSRLNETFKKSVPLIGLSHTNLKEASAKLIQDMQAPDSAAVALTKTAPNTPFVHLHTLSQFTVLQSTIRVKELAETADQMGMPAVALTDLGNLMGAFHFVKSVKQVNAKRAEDDDRPPLKPIVGITLNVCEDHLDRSRRDNGYQIVFLAKNKAGYQNLSKLSSLAYTKGFYYVPRIDKKLIKQYKDNLIVLTGNIYGEVSSKLLNVGENQAEEALLWWKEQFQEDLYIEIMRHKQEDENRINPVLIQFSQRHNVKLVATNSVFYIKQEEANAHDILLCVKDGEKQSTPIGRGRGYRYGLPNQEYYFKTSAQMQELFADVPQALESIAEILDKITAFDLVREVLLPKFDIPDAFQSAEDASDGGKRGENAYLRHITYVGAKARYGSLNDELTERIDFELSVIKNTGYPGYFLIVEDFIAAAREMDVSVGPGRGSAAGSVVAYCLKITNIDPIKYDLLFERFLNPDRVSLPDIDIDFDDEGRSKVIDYVIEKYGSNQVAQIITYGTMAAKSSIRDTARVLDLSLGDADRVAKLVPNMKLKKIFNLEDKELKEALRSDEFARVAQLKSIAEGNDLEAETLKQALILEGSLRNTGTHACGVIITPDDITEFVPIATAKDSDLFVTQFDNSVVEDAGLLKMDFLGLKTLTLIKDTVKIVKYQRNIELKPDEFLLDDGPTYTLFQRGETIGIFQYESAGMQKYLRDLKPNVFEDLIAMNALYRPGPLEYIPSFIRRKNGEEEISYDLPEMEQHLKQTYGITVYQEQVMQLSQALAGFTKGEADVLRKAMGKKIFALLEQLKPKFLDGGEELGHPREVLEKIWKDWEAFASYAFNKSHSTCYAWIAYQTAYLKANYPAEYMAAVLSNNMNDIKQVSFFMEECRRMGILVLGPDVNESFYKFTVNNKGAIRFGMGAVKGVGRGAVETIVEHRKVKPYESIFDLTQRIDLRSANKKSFESLILAGGLDSLSDASRSQYFHHNGDGVTFVEKALKFGAQHQENEQSSQVSLFGADAEVTIATPELPNCEPWTALKELKQEKEVVGIYISAHPLDDFAPAMKHFCNAKLGVFNDMDALVNRELSFGGMVGEVDHRVSKNGKGWAIFGLEDFEDSYQFKIFGEEYLKYRHFLVEDNFIHVKASVREGWLKRETGKRGAPRMQFNAFQLLQDTLTTSTHKITLKLDVTQADEKLASFLYELFKKHKGDHKVDMTFYETEDEIKLHTTSRKLKVHVGGELLEALDGYPIVYKLN